MAAKFVYKALNVLVERTLLSAQLGRIKMLLGLITAKVASKVNTSQI